MYWHFKGVHALLYCLAWSSTSHEVEACFHFFEFELWTDVSSALHQLCAVLVNEVHWHVAESPRLSPYTCHPPLSFCHEQSRFNCGEGSIHRELCCFRGPVKWRLEESLRLSKSLQSSKNVIGEHGVFKQSLETIVVTFITIYLLFKTFRINKWFITWLLW